MSRPPRITLPGGTYYLVQQGGAGRPIFACPDDYSMFEQLVAAALRRHRATAYAYCWLPDAIHLIVRAGEAPIGRLMQGLTSRYARQIHRREGGSGHFFRTRYQASLIDADAYLSKLVHYVHYLPVLSELAARPEDYIHTSHRAYLGLAESAWINARAMLTQLRSEDESSDAYARLLANPPADSDVGLLSNCGRSAARVIGGSEFVATLPRHARKYRSKISLDQIVHTVSQALGVDREHVLSSSRRRDLALARALIAWFAIERRVATLTEVARLLKRDPSTLSVAISRYSVSRQDLFRLNSLYYMTPIGPTELPTMRLRTESDDGAEWATV